MAAEEPIQFVISELLKDVHRCASLEIEREREWVNHQLIAVRKFRENRHSERFQLLPRPNKHSLGRNVTQVIQNHYSRVRPNLLGKPIGANQASGNHKPNSHPSGTAANVNMDTISVTRATVSTSNEFSHVADRSTMFSVSRPNSHAPGSVRSSECDTENLPRAPSTNNDMDICRSEKKTSTNDKTLNDVNNYRSPILRVQRTPVAEKLRTPSSVSARIKMFEGKISESHTSALRVPSRKHDEDIENFNTTAANSSGFNSSNPFVSTSPGSCVIGGPSQDSGSSVIGGPSQDTSSSRVGFTKTFSDGQDFQKTIREDIPRIDTEPEEIQMDPLAGSEFPGPSGAFVGKRGTMPEPERESQIMESVILEEPSDMCDDTAEILEEVFDTNINRETAIDVQMDGVNKSTTSAPFSVPSAPGSTEAQGRDVAMPDSEIPSQQTSQLTSIQRHVESSGLSSVHTSNEFRSGMPSELYQSGGSLASRLEGGQSTGRSVDQTASSHGESQQGETQTQQPACQPSSSTSAYPENSSAAQPSKRPEDMVNSNDDVSSLSLSSSSSDKDPNETGESDEVINSNVSSGNFSNGFSQPSTQPMTHPNQPESSSQGPSDLATSHRNMLKQGDVMASKQSTLGNAQTSSSASACRFHTTNPQTAASKPPLSTTSRSPGEAEILGSPPQDKKLTPKPLTYQELKRRRMLIRHSKNAEDNYDLSERESTDEEADDSPDRSYKKIPFWCNNWMQTVKDQTAYDPDVIFGTKILSPELARVFGTLNVPPKRRKRGSSANWENDTLTLKEIENYKKTMGHTKIITVD